MLVATVMGHRPEVIGGALLSLKDVVDFVLILWLGKDELNISQDLRTICKGIEVRNLGEFDFYKGFDYYRNIGLDYLREKFGDGIWVLSLDDDERLVGGIGLKDFLEDFTGENRVVGLRLKLEGWHRQKGGKVIWTAPFCLRLFKLVAGLKYTGKIHEQISQDLVRHGRILKLNEEKARIVHLGYDISEMEMEQKLRRNYKLLMEEIINDKMNGYLLYHLGNHYVWEEKYNEAFLVYKMALKLGILNPELIYDVNQKIEKLKNKIKK